MCHCLSAYLGINKKEVSIANDELKGDKRYEYEVEESIPHPQYQVTQCLVNIFRTWQSLLIGK
jgi:hypothetical protein